MKIHMKSSKKYLFIILTTILSTLVIGAALFQPVISDSRQDGGQKNTSMLPKTASDTSHNNYDLDFNITEIFKPTSIGMAVAFDNSSNIYVAISEFVPSSGYASYLYKYNSNGGKYWGKQVNTSNFEIIRDIYADNKGNLYIAGEILNVSNGYSKVFINKVNTTGHYIMNISWNPSHFIQVWGITLDNKDNIYITGHNSTEMSGNNNGYIAKFNQSGDLIMTIFQNISEREHPVAIEVDNKQNIYITGYTHQGSEGNNAFVCKYNSSGDSVLNITWHNGQNDVSYDLALDNQSNIYIAGKYLVDMMRNAFIAKFNGTTGSSLMNITCESEFREIWSIELDNLNDIYVTGYYQNDTGSKIPFFKFNSSGECLVKKLWSMDMNGTGRDLVIGGDGGVYITGSFFPDEISGVPILKYAPQFYAPVSITVNTPENTTYITGNISINATVKGDTETVLVEIDGAMNITLIGAGEDIYYNDTISLSDGSHSLRVFANDTHGNLNSSALVYFIVNLEPPGWDEEPQDREVELGDSLYYDVNASDLQEILYGIDDWENFTIDQEGMVQNNTVLDVGTYLLQLNASDGFYDNLKTITITVVDTSDPIWLQPGGQGGLFIGIGVGIGIGAAAVIGILFYFKKRSAGGNPYTYQP